MKKNDNKGANTKMGKKEIVNNDPVSNFRELVDRYKRFEDNVAFQYKQKGKIKDITYKKFREDIKALRNRTFEFGRHRKNSNNWKQSL